MRRSLFPCIWALLAAIVAIAGPAPSSLAADEPPSEYVSVRLGVYSPQHDDLNNFSEGFNGELFYGYYFRKHLAAEIGIGYFNTDSSETPMGSISIDMLSIMFNIKASYRFGPVELFAGPGVGLYTATARYEDLGEESDWEGGYGFNFSAGANYNFDKAWFLGVEGRYLWAWIRDPLIPSSGPLDTHIDGLTGTLVLGCRF